MDRDRVVNESDFSRSLLVRVLPFFLWGTAMVAMKGAIAQTTPWFLAGLRLFPAGMLVLVAAVWQGRSQPRGWLAWLWIGLFALVDGAMFQGFLAVGLERTGAGLGSAIIDSQPLAVALLSSWLFGEAIGWLGWLGLAIGIVGISSIGVPESWFRELLAFNWGALSESWHWQDLLGSGELFMLLASLSMAVGTVIIRFVSRYSDPMMATGWHMVLGGVPLLAFSLMGGAEPWQHLDASSWLGLAYATVFGSAIAYGLFFWLAVRENLTSLSALTFLTPVFALSFSSLLLGEELSTVQWVGVVGTLASIYLINQRENLTEDWKRWLKGTKIPDPAATPSPASSDD